MRRVVSIAILAVFVFALVFPANAKVNAYVSGDLAIKILDDTPGAIFRNVNVDEERYLFRVPVIAEFIDTDGSGNFTIGDTIVGVAVLHDLVVNIISGTGYVNITRMGDVTIRPTMKTAHVEIYLYISNSTVNEAKRGAKIVRDRANAGDMLLMLVIFAAIDPQMQMHHSIKHKHENHIGHVNEKAELEMQANHTVAKAEFEPTCMCDGQQRPVNVTAFERSYQRKHAFGCNYDAHLATQIVFSQADTIVYDPEITVETVSAASEALTSPVVLSIIAAILIVIGAIAIVLRNRKK